MSNITYKQLLNIISWAIFTKPLLKNQVQNISDIKKIEGAEYGGVYIGSPGRDIYFMLPYLSGTQMKEVAEKLSEKFPFKPPKVNVQYSACIRFIYGQFEKQGALRSDDDLKRMKKEKIDWELPRAFIKCLKEEMEKKEKYYGLTIVLEIEAHRFGDEGVVGHNKDKMKEMESSYLRSIDFAHKCKSYKHMFSLYFWAAKYFKKFGDKEKSLEYYSNYIEASNLYCDKYVPEGEKIYTSRLVEALKYIKKNDKKRWKNILKDIIKSKTLKIAFNKVKK